MKINKIDHVCIAVKNLKKAREVWEELLDRNEPDEEYTDEPEKIRVARYYIGEVGFELVESTSDQGEVAKFIEKHGEGLMLLSLNVDSTSKAISELREKGYPVIGEPKKFRTCQYAFVHPKVLNGVLLELIDDKS